MVLSVHRLSSGQQAYAFIDQWLRDQRDTEKLKTFAHQIGEELEILQQLDSFSAETLQDVACFEEVDQIIIRQCVKAILPAGCGIQKSV